MNVFQILIVSVIVGGILGFGVVGLSTTCLILKSRACSNVGQHQ